MESLARLRAHAGSWTLVALLAAATTLSVTVAGPAVTAIEDRALRQALAAAPYHHRDITITQQSRPELAALRRTRLPGAAEMRDEVEAAMPPVLRDAFSSGWGYQRTVVGPQEPPRSGLGASLVGDGVTAAPDGWAPVVALHHQTDLAAEIGAHRWILRAVAALSARTRAATPLLAAARAARASPVAGVALVVLVLAVTTGAFAATVNGAVAEARDQQAVREVGAHARVTGDSPARVPLTLLWPPAPDLAGAASAVMSVSGVTDVAAVRRDGELRSGGRLVQGVEVVAIDAPAYQRLLVALGVEQRLAVEIIEAGPDTDPLPVLAPPSIGVRPEVTVRLDGEQRPVVVVVGDVAGLPGPDRDRLWVLVPRQALAAPGPADELLVAGAGVDADAVRAAASAALTGTDPAGTDPAGAVSGLAVISLDEHRAALERAGFHRGISQLLLTGGLAGWAAALVAIVLLLVTPASERARFLALVRAIGLSTGQARRVVAAELAPVIAVAGGVGVGLGTLLPVMVAPALGLGGFTGGTPPHYTLDLTWSGLMAGSMLGLAAAAVLLISIGEPSTDLRSSGHMTSESRQGRHGTSPRRRRIAGARRDRKEATAVRREDQERFRQFVTERTPELFGVAFDLAGRQDAAERQLQGALERLALRWRRERDPFRFTALCRGRAGAGEAGCGGGGDDVERLASRGVAGRPGAGAGRFHPPWTGRGHHVATDAGVRPGCRLGDGLRPAV